MPGPGGRRRALIALVAGLTLAHAPRPAPGAPVSAVRAGAPLRFEPGPGNGFFARCGNYRLFLDEGEAVFALQRASTAAPSGARGARGDGVRRTSRSENASAIRMVFGGGLPSPGPDRLPGVSHYLVGDDPALWRTSVPAYSAVVYRNVRPGVDLRFRGNPRDVEYDLLIAPGGDPGSLDLRFEGAASVVVDGAGDLVFATPDGELRHRAPVAWQVGADGERVAVPVRWRLSEEGRASFDVGSRDPSLPLVVDPAITWSTYLGGGNLDAAYASAVDASGSLHVVGWTQSTNHPVQGAFQGSNLGGTDDAFVLRLSADGATLLYATYLGGNGFDEAYTIALPGDGSIVVGGDTSSTNFPTVAPLQPAFGGGTYDGFLVRLAPGGASLSYATYLGGAGFDDLNVVAMDAAGRYHVAGDSSSTNLPVVTPFQATFGGGAYDVFTAIIGADGATLDFASYLGGTGDEAANFIGVDATGRTVLGGVTTSTNFPVVGGVQGSYGGGNSDAFVAAYGPSGGSLAYSTYFGGAGIDPCNAGAVDAAGAVTFVGYTSSPAFPLVSPFQPTIGGGGNDAYVARLDPTGSSIVFSSLLGGNGFDQPYGVALDASGATYLCGLTTSTTFPVKRAFQGTYSGGQDDAFVARVSASGGTLDFATYLGGSGFDEATTVCVDGQGGFMVAGATSSLDFPLKTPVQGSSAGGTYDSFLMRFLLVPPLAPSLLVADAVGTTSVHLSWSDNSSDEYGFEIDRRRGADPFARLATAPAGARVFDDFQTVPGETYTYRVRATGPEGTSGWSNEATATTNHNPAVPKNFTATAVSATGIDLAWTDASDNEISFEISRRAGTGPWVVLPSAPGDTTSRQDRGLQPDQAYAYRLRALGSIAASVYAPDASATTHPSITIESMKGTIKDVPKFGKDKVKISGVVTLLPASPDAAFDPRADGLTVLVGAEIAPLQVVVPGGGEGWTEKKGKLTWKSPKGAPQKVAVTFVLATRTLTVKVSGAEFPAPPGNPVRLGVRIGDDAGSLRGNWIVKKPGSFAYP